MCGFAGVFSKNKNLENLVVGLQKAGKSITHRGPDDQGVYSDSNIGLCFNRLSIIDTSQAAHQPMFTPDKRYVLVFNGEIYNYKELHRELKSKGISFESSSDTEVLLKLLQFEGVNCLSKLRGMFAFAFWDIKEKKLILARDRFGIKPLYYFEDRFGRVFFASEIKSILVLAKELGVIDQISLNNKSAFKFLARCWVDDSNETFFNPIFSLEPSTYFNIGKENKKVKYWDLLPNPHKLFDEEEFRSVFKEAVSVHLRSDVPLAFTLSGGLDSSSIVGMATSLYEERKDLIAYSVLPPNTIDEREWINATVSHTGISHQYIDLLSPTINYDDILKKVIGVNDEPVQSSSILYQYLLREKIKEKGVKVILVGEGGDEVLAGYRRMYYPFLFSLEKMGKNTVSEIELSSGFMGISSLEITNEFERYKKICREGLSGQEDLSSYSVLKSDWINLYQEVVNQPAFPIEKPYLPLTNHLIQHLFTRDLPYILRMEDRISMANSLEARVPFLDHVLVEYIFQISLDEFMKKGQNKSMLRRAMKGLLPSNVLNRKSKSGRPGNNAHTSYQIFSQELKESILQEEDILAPNCLKLFEEDVKNQNSKRAEFWFRLLVYSRWRSQVLL